MNKLYILSAILVILTACVHEDMPQVCPSGETTISLSMSKMPVKETRSDAFENLISDACILVFGSDGKYKKGEMVAVATNLKNNQTKNPTISTNLIISDGETIVVLCNTGLTQLPDLVVGESTPNEVNNHIKIDAIELNQKMKDCSQNARALPMSGTAVWNNLSRPIVDMFFSVAKITLYSDSYSFSTPGLYFDPITQYDTKDFRWTVCNMLEYGNIYSQQGKMNERYDGNVSFDDLSFEKSVLWWGDRDFNNSDTYYVNEVLNTYRLFCDKQGMFTGYMGPINYPYTARPCILLKTYVGYFRIDFAEGNNYDETKKFLDLKRNVNYNINIKNISGIGYATPEEALSCVAGNLEYEIVVESDDCDVLAKNGSYALLAESSNFYIIKDKSLDPQKLPIVKTERMVTGAGIPETRFARLVTSSNEIISEQYCQLCKPDGTPIPGNVYYFSENEDVIELKIKYNRAFPLRNGEEYYHVRYGSVEYSIRLYETDLSFSTRTLTFNNAGGSSDFTVTSTSGTTLSDWALTFSYDGGASWTMAKPDWLLMPTSSNQTVPSSTGLINQDGVRSFKIIATPMEENDWGSRSVKVRVVQSKTGAENMFEITQTYHQAHKAIVSITDDKFKAFCVASFDTDKDGEISLEEALAVTSMDCSNKELYSLEGIEHFSNLKTLICSGNHFESLDLSANYSLSTLDVTGNQSLNKLDYCKGVSIKNDFHVGKYLVANKQKGVVFTQIGTPTKILAKIGIEGYSWMQFLCMYGATSLDDGRLNSERAKLNDGRLYLPALNELKEIYENKDVINAALTANNLTVNGKYILQSVVYWSSSEVDPYKAYAVQFSDGTVLTQEKSTKSLKCYVTDL